MELIDMIREGHPVVGRFVDCDCSRYQHVLVTSPRHLSFTSNKKWGHSHEPTLMLVTHEIRNRNPISSDSDDSDDSGGADSKSYLAAKSP
jgi:hypothetical protein